MDQVTKQREPFSFSAVMYLTGGLIALFLICTTILMVMDKDIQPFLIVGNMLVTPLLGLLGVKAYQTMSGKMDSLQQDMNGRMTTLIDHAANSVPLDKVERVETTK